MSDASRPSDAVPVRGDHADAAEANTAYDARATVGPQRFERLMHEYRAASDRATAGLAGHQGVVYDDVSGERLDIWGVSNEPRPAVVFIHGGYWRMLSRHDSAFMAGMLAGQSIATVAVDYTLSPQASLEEIVRQVRAAVAWVHRHGACYGIDPDRVVVSGSSAGGHLTGMALLDGWQHEYGVPEDVVAAAMPFSGLFDLTPLLDTFVNGWLEIDETRARALSPIRHLPDWQPPTVFVVADGDAHGFHTQTAEFHRLWSSRTQRRSELLVVPARNHFNVVLDLASPDTEASRSLADLVRTI